MIASHAGPDVGSAISSARDSRIPWPDDWADSEFRPVGPGSSTTGRGAFPDFQLWLEADGSACVPARPTSTETAATRAAVTRTARRRGTHPGTGAAQILGSLAG